ncbi:unnamed protein product, partial [Urochloa decumbens]
MQKEKTKDKEIRADQIAGNNGMATTDQSRRVMEKEKKRFTRAEKGKESAFAAQQELQSQGQRSNPFKTMAEHSLGRNSELLQGECSHSSTSRPKSASWTDGQQHRQSNPHTKLAGSLSTDSLKQFVHIDEQGFQAVKPAYWWRKEPHSRREAQPHQPKEDEQRKLRYKERVRGKCLNCFSTEHRVADCRWRTKCWNCSHSGHKAHACPSRSNQNKGPAPEHQRRQHPHPTSSIPIPTIPAVRPADRSYLQAAKGEPAAMASYPGDPCARPELAHYMISATGAIKRKRESLIGKTAVCRLNGNSHDSGTHHVVDALHEQLHIDRHELKIVKHYPEQYLVFFSDTRAYHRALQHYRGVPHRGRTFYFEPWTERRGAEASKLEFQARLRIEGLPVHAWSEEVAAKIIGQHCAIHYIEGYSRRQERTRTYDLWAWSSNP